MGGQRGLGPAIAVVALLLQPQSSERIEVLLRTSLQQLVLEDLYWSSSYRQTRSCRQVWGLMQLSTHKHSEVTWQLQPLTHEVRGVKESLGGSLPIIFGVSAGAGTGPKSGLGLGSSLNVTRRPRLCWDESGMGLLPKSGEGRPSSPLACMSRSSVRNEEYRGLPSRERRDFRGVMIMRASLGLVEDSSTFREVTREIDGGLLMCSRSASLESIPLVCARAKRQTLPRMVLES